MTIAHSRTADFDVQENMDKESPKSKLAGNDAEKEETLDDVEQENQNETDEIRKSMRLPKNVKYGGKPY